MNEVSRGGYDEKDGSVHIFNVAGVLRVVDAAPGELTVLVLLLSGGLEVDADDLVVDETLLEGGVDDGRDLVVGVLESTCGSQLVNVFLVVADNTAHPASGW